MARTLPDFRRPPLTEVVLGVQFEPLAGFGSVHSGLFWERIRESFPRVEERPTLQPVIERFGGRPARDLGVRWQVLDVPPPIRYWFLTEQGDQLIQLQSDRFLHNWRKRGPEDTYPRYEGIRQSFERELSLFQSFLTDHGLSHPEPNQCEVTYVNHIFPGDVWEHHSQLDRVLTITSGQYSDDFLGGPEDSRFAARYIIPDHQGTPLGRLHISAKPGFEVSTGQPIIVLELTARGQPQGEGTRGVLPFLDLGREWIVRGFTSITTPAMHQIWERTDA
ncbi:MAG: TIGR04255 family protein [Thermoanaerobaculia bacterium]